MRQIYHLFTFLILFSSISFWGCVGDYNNGQQHSSTNAHNYPTSGSGNIETDPRIDEIETSIEETNRFTWQKPKEVIKSLGDLSDKTIVDIGAGPNGYFTFKFVRSAKKVIAVDIDKSAIAYMDSIKSNLPDPLQAKMETRLVSGDDPKLKKGEADIVFISNIYAAYIDDRAGYLEKVKNGIPKDGVICIVDFKMRKINPIFEPPPLSDRVPLYQVEQELEAAGFEHVVSHDDVLEYQYIVIARKVK